MKPSNVAAQDGTVRPAQALAYLESLAVPLSLKQRVKVWAWALKKSRTH